MKCVNCGAEIAADATMCPACGKTVEGGIAPEVKVVDKATEAQEKPKKRFEFGYFIAGLLLPTLGLVLFLIDRETFPGKARSAGIGAIIGAVLSVILPIVLIGGYFGFLFLFIILMGLMGI